MPDPELLKELQRYVRFSPEDEAALKRFVASFGQAVPAIAEEFYARILEHPFAARVLSGGDAQLARLHETLGQWLLDTLSGPWDADYFERHARIGRRHVEVGLEQHYMFVAMALIRRQLCDHACEQGPSEPECAARVRALNKVLDLELAIMLHTYREDYSAEVRDRERHAVVTQLLPTVAKELHNPLTVIDSSAFLLQDKVEAGKARDHVAKIRQHAQRASRIVEGMLELARERRPVLRPTALLGVVQGVAAATDCGATQLSIHHPEDAPTADVDPQYAEQILRHLLRNAIEASPSGKVDVHLDTEDGQVVVRVADDGPGIPPSILERIFEPMTTTKSHGAGLGLSLCKALAEAQGGSLHAADGPLGGACIEWRVGPRL